ESGFPTPGGWHRIPLPPRLRRREQSGPARSGHGVICQRSRISPDLRGCPSRNGSGSNFVMLASRTPGLVGVWLCVGVLSARVERQGGGVVASAVLFDLVEAGEQCGHGGRPVA